MRHTPVTALPSLWPVALLAGLLAACEPSAPDKEASTTTPDDSTPDDSTPDDDTTDGEGSGSGDGGSDGTDSGPTDSGEPEATPWDEGPPPVVVLFIGDGMGFAHVEGGGILAHGIPGSLTMETAPHQGRLQTASLTGYTDSAAAATTMATGHKTENGRIGQDAHGDELEGLVDLARLRGLSVGVVTTDKLTGATPTAFLVHADSRHDTESIAGSLAAELPEVLFGGGGDALLPSVEGGPALLVRTAVELSAAPVDLTRPLVGVFAPGELPFVAEQPPEDPTPRLPLLVEAALDHLLTDPDGALLIVEAARIDHASHMNRGDAVFDEVVELDAAVEQTLARLATLEDQAVTVVVTADHECGGLELTDTVPEPETGRPPTRWRWLDHTNRDVPVFGWGEATAGLDGARSQNSAVWAVLDGALRSRAPALPPALRVPDGALDDLGPPVVVQTADTDYGAGYNQLDALRVATDERGLWIGIDGTFDERANLVTVWLDLDHGAGTGAGADLVLSDATGALDRLIGLPEVDLRLPGLGFDAAVGQIGATYARADGTSDTAGLRQFQPPEGLPEDLAWKRAAINYDDGNVADGVPAPDAAPTGTTTDGMEIFVAWTELWPAGLPAGGAELALLATLSAADGGSWSNQALPPQAVGGEDNELIVRSVVAVSVDADGALRSAPRVEP